MRIDPKLLRCTQCSSEAPLTAKENPARLVCTACHQEFPVSNNVALMIRKERDEDTLKKFEHQWKVWGGDPVVFGEPTEGHERRFLLACPHPAFPRAWFRGKRVLEAACGHGLMAEVFTKLNADTVAMDLRDCVMRAARRLVGTNAVLVQGDILDIPLQKNKFDFVHCCGVIHHTRDPRLAFKKLASVTKEGGGVYLWLYPKKGIIWEVTMAAARAITTRLPPALLSKLAFLMVPLLYVVPAFSGTSPRKNSWRQCAQVIYDWLSPKYQSHHTL